MPPCKRWFTRFFIGQVPGNEKLYASLRSKGYELIFKPTTIHKENDKPVVKGNVDAELVLYAAAIYYKRYKKAIIVSGDGDFACLIDFL